MNPRDALAQQDLLRTNLTKPGHHAYLQHFSEDVYRKKAAPLVVGSDGKPDGRALAAYLINILEVAETFYVSADMADVAAFASKTLDDLDRFAHDLWPTDFGFLTFQRGLITQDVWGKPVSFKAMTWSRRSHGGHAGTLVCTFSDMDDERDSLNLQTTSKERDEMAVDLGRLLLSHTFWIADDMRVGPAESPTPKGYERFGDEGDALATTATNNVRLILALLMLLGQTVAVTTKHDLRPSNPKRARKMKVPGQVTVITLRHAKESKQQEGESRVEWTHRWLVRGFWRNQSVGPNYPQAVEVGPGKYRARIWVAPFIKGPQGAPIVQSRKVNSLTR